MAPKRFVNRVEAGRELARALTAYKDRSDVIVLGLPRGGVPVAFEVAKHLAAPLDVFLVRKLGVPTHPELAMGAIAEGGIEFATRLIAVSGSALVSQVACERLELDHGIKGARRQAAAAHCRSHGHRGRDGLPPAQRWKQRCCVAALQTDSSRGCRAG
jgi:predicted phosphoribosyltransferase